MTEQYYWWSGWVKRLSRTEIRKMKENMQKTPLVQEKSNNYHRIEEEKAEKIMDDIINEAHSSKKIEEEKEEVKNIWFFERIKNYLFK